MNIDFDKQALRRGETRIEDATGRAVGKPVKPTPLLNRPVGLNPAGGCLSIQEA